MLPANDMLQALITTLVARDSSNRRAKEAPAPLRPGPSDSRPTLESLNHDVLRLIALELYRMPGELKRLASCSRTLRQLASPVLFSRCRRPDQIYPPDNIRPFARYLTYTGPVGAAFKYFEQLLDCFPSLTAVAFEKLHGPSWSVLRVCLSRPRISSISFNGDAELTLVDGFPTEEVSATSTSVSSLTYNVRLWRGLRNHMDRLNGYRDLSAMVANESRCLSDLVPGMNETLTRLLLQMESAPILKMAEKTWPKLRELSISGTYWGNINDQSLPVLLGALPHLEELSVRICRGLTLTLGTDGRPPILGQHRAPRSVLSGMRSLTVAYPNPDDDIFGVDTSQLRHLSICDWPRHYNALIYKSRYPVAHRHPILSSTECLTILRRMDLPELSSLELVYLADHAGADDDLLQYVANTFPNLAHLELHRYRADREEEVDHAHIARLLSALRSLRTLRLNLDFHGDHGPYCNEYEVRKAWWNIFRGTLGWEIVDIMQDCPLLGCVELLYHSSPTATWVEFHPPRCGEPRFVMSYDKYHREPELMPYAWDDYFPLGPWSGGYQ